MTDKKWFLNTDVIEGTNICEEGIPHTNRSIVIAATFPGTLNVIALCILKKGYKTFKNINDDDAKREGFNCADELKEELMCIYPHLEDYNRIYYYQFKPVAQIIEENVRVVE